MEGQRARRWLLEGKEEDLEEDGKEDNDNFGDEVDEEEKDERNRAGREKGPLLVRKGRGGW